MAKVRLSKRVKGVLSLIVGALCLLVAGLLLNRAYAVAEGKDVEGRVVSVAEGAVEVRFPGLKRSRTQTFALDAEASKGLRKGRRIKVVVVSAEEAHLLGEGPSAIPIVILFLLAVVLIGGGAITCVRPG